MKFEITAKQQAVIDGATGIPTGRKGSKFRAWANGLMDQKGLPHIKAFTDDGEELESDSDPESDKKPTPQPAPVKERGAAAAAAAAAATAATAKPHSTAAAAAAAAAAAGGKAVRYVPRTFIIQEGTLEGPGFSLTIKSGRFSGYFEESTERRTKAQRDDLLALKTNAAVGETGHLSLLLKAAEVESNEQRKQQMAAPATGGHSGKGRSSATAAGAAEEAPPATGGHSSKARKARSSGAANKAAPANGKGHSSGTAAGAADEAPPAAGGHSDKGHSSGTAAGAADEAAPANDKGHSSGTAAGAADEAPPATDSAGSPSKTPPPPPPPPQNQGPTETPVPAATIAMTKEELQQMIADAANAAALAATQAIGKAAASQGNMATASQDMVPASPEEGAAGIGNDNSKKRKREGDEDVADSEDNN